LSPRFCVLASEQRARKGECSALRVENNMHILWRS
jgi:hypothetical protein